MARTPKMLSAKTLRSSLNLMPFLALLYGDSKPVWAVPSDMTERVRTYREFQDDEPQVEVRKKPAKKTQKQKDPAVNHYSYRFKIQKEDRPYVNFWIDIYAKYDTTQGLVHDAKHVGIVYEILDFDGVSSSKKGKIIREAKKKWRAVLRSVHKKQKEPDRMNNEERRVFHLYRKIKEPTKFLQAARRKRMRFQLGQRDRFKEGVRISGRYLRMMQRVFKQEGVPRELTRLPLVESSFNTKARSKVGASGVWQFIPSTARRYLTINEVVDERNDPYRATRAAARLLRDNFKAIQAWPVAVTAYNHGRKGMMRAIRQVGSTDVHDIVERYHSRTYGFASKNFYFEFLAAVHVERNQKRYFGEIIREKPERFVEVAMADFVSLDVLTRYLGLSKGDFKEMNPGFTNAVLRGRMRVPRLYSLRIPNDWGLEKGGPRKAFWKGYKKIPSNYKHRNQRGQRVKKRKR